MADSPVSTAVTLSMLLPDSYLLAYAIPLLLLSIVVTFAGAFLTLDRSRSFAPFDKPLFIPEHHRAPIWRLEGGLGGIMAGWLCGMHLTTYLALMVLNRSSLTLSAIQFLVIWVLCSTPLAVIGSRWRIAACVFYAIVGGASFTAVINIVFLPSTLLPRLITCTIFIILFTIGTLLPIPVLQHASLRTCSALTGSTGIVIAIALFTNVVSWSDPWLTLAITQIVGSRNSKEKGLSAALCILTAAGAAIDWLLKTKLGENPDQQWDAYLAKYSRQLPLSEDRAGSFQPFESFWTRLFQGRLLHPRSPKDDILFPPDSQLLPTSGHAASGIQDQKEKPLFSGTPPPSFRPYPNTRKQSLLTKRVTLRDDSSSDSSDDDENTLKGELRGTDGPPKFRPWLLKRTSTGNSAATTIAPVGEIGGFAPPPKIVGTPTIAEEYSDVEEDVTSALADKDKDADRESPGWKPAFLRKHEDEVRRAASIKSLKTQTMDDNDPAPRFLSESPTPLSRQNTNQSAGPQVAAGLELPVPVQSPIAPTPSLIQAYDRISRAHQHAAQVQAPSASPRKPSGPLDESFWNNVYAKAGELRTAHR